ncbi:MAG TPA: protein tonB [Stenotrophomonas sp.]|nr:protein tonB [Stenotrophomonas sp.]
MVKGIGVLALAIALGGGLAPAAVLASGGAGPASVRKQIESSLLVSGNVDIEPDGSVSRLDIDHEDKLPEGVVKFVRDNAMAWRFEPVIRDGKVVKARAPMNLRVVARKLDDGNYRIALRGVSFERYDAADPHGVSWGKMTPPSFPTDAFRSGASATVYLLVKVGRDGRVEDAVAEQVNLRIVASEGAMRRFRTLFADSTLAAARKWTFRVPAKGKEADAPYWSVRVPVSYSLEDQPVENSERDYGKWISYVPGPRQVAPWSDEQADANFSPDTLTDGGIYMASSNAPRLLTPLQGG